MHFHPLFLGVLFSGFLLGSAFAGQTTVSVEIKGPDGRAAKNAEVRFERVDKRQAPIIVRTDARGHLNQIAVPAGTYRLIATSKEGSKSAQVFSTDGSRPLLFTFDMKPLSGSSAASPKKKVFVWVDSLTGTHMGGHYEEFDPSGRNGSHANGLNIDTLSGNDLERTLHNRQVFVSPGTVP
ncbi:MAG: hypothetical protein ACR2HH_05265 [Chthoniobacterales bacterium]